MISRSNTSNRTNLDLPDSEVIRIRGARVHNLQSVDVDIPRDAFTVITGVSGSGKSSLAFDTLFAEGQRQYIESLSTYARQFFDQLPRPDVDLVEGLEPTLCIDQKRSSNSPRSTVATVTEIYDYLRLLFARAGIPHCPQCGASIDQQTPEQIVSSLGSLPTGTKLMLLAPMVRGRRGQHRDVFETIAKSGLVRARVDGEVFPLEDIPELSPRRNHTIEAVVDRIVLRPDSEDRLVESARLALRLGSGVLQAIHQRSGESEWIEQLFSTSHACPSCEISFDELEPRSFSFNSPYGACPTCEGTGQIESFDIDRCVPTEDASVSDVAAQVMKGVSKTYRTKYQKAMEDWCAAYAVDVQSEFRSLSVSQRQLLVYGEPQRDGMLEILEKEQGEIRGKQRLKYLATLRSMQTCPACLGGRLRQESLAVTVGDLSIRDVTQLSIDACLDFFAGLQLTGTAAVIAKPLLHEICNRLRFLCHVGVAYLSLDRQADGLSGGELQRVRLATSIGSGLVGVCYVLDEPSIGLHARDNDRLIEALRELQAAGNTVVVVEHDAAMMLAADWLIDMGPGAGQLGGTILASGSPASIQQEPASVTGKYLFGDTPTLETSNQDRNPATRPTLNLAGVTHNNLQRVHLTIPLHCLVGISGVSGSGKSSLIVDTLYPAVLRELGTPGPSPGAYESIGGCDSISKMIAIDQSSIGRSPRSCPATFSGVFDEIRKVFAATREAKQRGYTTSRFSFNSVAGRCPQCAGQGQERIEMNFLSDLFVTCSVCNGKRFNQQTLRVRYKHATIADVLEMTIDEAADFFANFAKIDRFLSSLKSVGLGYLRLGQSSTTLSGGEAQRLKLATELARPAAKDTIYLLDEPTTGLHFEDVRRLIRVLHSLVDRGNTVLVIEHQLDVLQSCDWLIDLGPDGGRGGGQIVATGTPDQLARDPDSPTGQYLHR